jgi:iron complex outermembrane receptor protein
MLRPVVFSFICFCLALTVSAEILPDYVVTASREGEDSLDANAQVTVVTADDIARSGKTSVIEVLEDVAGVCFRSYSTEAQAQVSMRGFGENSFGRVLVLVDGRKLNDPDMTGINWQAIQISSIDRIEILDGPSAVLYGSGAVGGVINIITKESAKGLTAEASVSYGSFGTKRALITGGYGTDTLGLLASADIYRTDGYRDRSSARNTNVTVNAFADVTDLVTIKPYFTYADVKYQMPGALKKEQFDADPTVAGNADDDGSEKTLGAGMLAQLRPGDLLTIECPLDWKRKDREANFGSSSWPTFADTGITTIGARPKAAWSGEGPTGNILLTGGLDFEGNFYACDTWTDEERTLGHDDFEITQFSWAPYLSADVALPRSLKASTGIRWDHTAIHAEKGALDESDTYGNLSWDAGLTWRPVENFSTYARTGTTYRIPFIDEKAQLYGGADFNADLEPEHGYDVELGARYRDGKRLSASANAYFMLMKDEIAYDQTTYLNVNMDRTRRIGGSASVTWTPVALVTLDGNVAYVRATFLSGDYKDNVVPLVPALTARAGATFNLPFGVSVAPDASYTGESYAGQDFANDAATIDSYALLGLTVGFAPEMKGSSFAVRFRMDNLLDVSYAPLAYYSPYTGTLSYYPAAGRSYTLSASFRY